MSDYDVAFALGFGGIAIIINVSIFYNAPGAASVLDGIGRFVLILTILIGMVWLGAFIGGKLDQVNENTERIQKLEKIE